MDHNSNEFVLEEFMQSPWMLENILPYCSPRLQQKLKNRLEAVHKVAASMDDVLTVGEARFVICSFLGIENQLSDSDMTNPL